MSFRNSASVMVLRFTLGLLLASSLLTVTTLAQEEPAGPSAEPAPVATSTTEPVPEVKKPEKSQINFFKLMWDGGIFMIPIGIMSIVAVAMSIERAINLRRDKVIPPELVTSLGQLGSTATGFDPRKAYRICQQFPSTGATIIRTMLLKVGRPHSEVEHAVAESCQREADKMYGNVRWINLAVSVTPLIGLLGTVWGMIICFHDTAQLDAGANRAEALAEGIYIALVTTLGGLMVAIPAAIVSHFYEGRIQTLMFQVEEMVFNILPQVERFEGRVRFTRHQDEAESMKQGDSLPEENQPVAAGKN
jgi:biopolymer transport protein ExbB